MEPSRRAIVPASNPQARDSNESEPFQRNGAVVLGKNRLIVPYHRDATKVIEGGCSLL